MKTAHGSAVCLWACIVSSAACSSASPGAERPCSGDAGDGGAIYGPRFDVDSTAHARILLFTYTTGYRHASIPDGIHAISAMASAYGLSVDVVGTAVDATGSYCGNQAAAPGVDTFSPQNLSRYAALVFLNATTSSRPDDTFVPIEERSVFEAYIRGGGGFVGIHAASDAEYGWPFYHEVLGATFLTHGPPVTASLRIEDGAHPATDGLPDPWLRYDEWYDFTANPRSTAHVLIHVDEATYPNNPSPMGDHPIAWCKTVGAGRSFYTGLGHTGEAFADPVARRHLLGGILYAAGLLPADCGLAAEAVPPTRKVR